ncbi:MAG: riboflavin kinase, partial [Alphaproteobacteria bacterium]
MLGHPWTVEGRVERGDQRGRTIGFPTANVSLEGYLEPALGVYAVEVELAGRYYKGVANFGRRPTFDKKDVLLEVHVFDFTGDLYGQPIVVAFIDFIRPEMKFAGLDALKAQIARDGETARQILR